VVNNDYQLQPHKIQYQNTWRSISYLPLHVYVSFPEHYQADNIQVQKKKL